MGIQTVLRMRATLRRDVGTQVNPFGGHIPDVQELPQTLRCYVQAKVDKTVTDAGRFFAITTFSIWAARNANLRNGDEVTTVADLRGVELFKGNFRVASLIQREDHAAGILERFS